MPRISYAAFLPLLVAVACTPAMSGDDTSAMPDAPNGSNAALDPADCDAFAHNAVAAQQQCGGGLPSGAEATLSAACKTGVSHASLCGADPAAGLACFRAPDPSDWVCQLGTILPSCNQDIDAALGMYCLVKLGDPSCASVACDGSLNCPSGASCNDVTHQCFSNSANCVGLPCNGSLDCPTGETCNSAEHACIKA